MLPFLEGLKTNNALANEFIPALRQSRLFHMEQPGTVVVSGAFSSITSDTILQ